MNSLGIKVGDFIKLSGSKWYGGIVTEMNEHDGEKNIIITKAIKPSPKSVLRKKSIFSKVKGVIVKT